MPIIRGMCDIIYVWCPLSIVVGGKYSMLHRFSGGIYTVCVCFVVVDWLAVAASATASATTTATTIIKLSFNLFSAFIESSVHDIAKRERYWLTGLGNLCCLDHIMDTDRAATNEPFFPSSFHFLLILLFSLTQNWPLLLKHIGKQARFFQKRKYFINLGNGCPVGFI